MSPEPAVVREHLAGPLRVLVISQHHIVSLGHNLALSGLRIHILELHLDLPCRDTDRADGCLAHAGVADERGRFGQPVSDGVWEMSLLEEVFHYRVKLRTSDAEELESAAECLVEHFSDEEIQYSRSMLLHP